MERKFNLKAFEIMAGCVGEYSMAVGLNPVQSVNKQRRSPKFPSPYHSKDLSAMTKMAEERLKLHMPDKEWNNNSINMYVQCGCKFQKHNNWKKDQKLMILLLEELFPHFIKKP